MRISTLAINAAAFALGLGLCYVAAGFAVNVIEDNSERGVRRTLDQAALPWAEVEAEGLQVRLHGTAPTEAQRFKAVSTAATVVDVQPNVRVTDGCRSHVFLNGSSRDDCRRQARRGVPL